MPNKLKLLLIPSSSNKVDLRYTAWGHILDSVDITELPYIEYASGNLDINSLLKLAKKYSKDNYDYIIGHGNAFLWLTIFRISGSNIPFAIIPDVNFVDIVDSFLLLSASQFLQNNDIVFSGSEISGQSFNMFGFNYYPTYPLGIPINLFRPLDIDKTKLKKMLNLPQEKKVLLYTGRFERDKGIEQLIAMFSQINKIQNIILIICYHISNINYLKDCQSRIGNNPDVLLIKNPNPHLLVEYYNAADLFVSAAISKCETFGRSPVEAMACGTLPVVPEYNGFRETITKESGFLITTKKLDNGQIIIDQDKFTETILNALSKKQSLNDMKSNAIQKAKNYDSKKTMSDMINTLREKIKEKESPYNLKENIKYYNLSEYPISTKNLWSKLSGECIYSVIKQFLLNGEPPYHPDEHLVESYHQDWFQNF